MENTPATNGQATAPLVTSDGLLGRFREKKREIKRLYVPLLGETVLLRKLSAFERDDFEGKTCRLNGQTMDMNYENLRARLCALCLCNDAGERIFQDSQVRQLGNEAPADALDLIYDEARKFNGFGQKNVEELVKNSEADLSAASPSS